MLKILYFMFIGLLTYIYFMRIRIGYIFLNGYIVDLIIENNLDSKM
jgi:hypothetical protein